jgi:hypothetical protein
MPSEHISKEHTWIPHLSITNITAFQIAEEKP